MLIRASLIAVLFVCLAAFFLSGAEPIQTDLRSLAHKQFEAGNFRDAWESYRKLALDPKDDPRQVGGDMDWAIRALARLGREEEVDAFREEVIGLHRQNWRLLHAAANSYIHDAHFGFIVAGKFVRGNKRGGGEYASALERDRVRALQLIEQAMPLLKAEPEQEAVASFYIDFARQLLSARGYDAAWELQALTDLSKLPDYERGSPYRWRGYSARSPQGAPVDAEGNPVFHRLPAKYESAASDGERWRWALAEAVEHSPARKNAVATIFAGFLHAQFGVQTMRSFGRFYGESGDDPQEESGPFAVHTLKDDETIARLAAGVKRFKLPEEFNFIRIYREVAASGKDSYAEQSVVALAQIFENRRQYPRAAETWRECIRRFGPGTNRERQQRLDQIVGAWGRFEPSATQPAGQGGTLGFRFRNGKRVEFEAQTIRIEKLLDDVKAYLKSNPRRLEWDKMNIGDVGYRLVQQNQSQYVGERVAQWSVDLEPRPNHFDRRIDVTTPLQKAGAYLVTARMADGNFSRIVLWIADTAIVRKPLSGAAYYYVADAASGAPVADANVEFFGYQQENVVPNQYQIRTTNFAEHTDADGQVVPDPKDLLPSHQWVVIARTKAGRFAYLGFDNVWYGNAQDPVYDQNKAFIVTDRPVYRPQQPVKFKVWVRKARYDVADATEFAGQSFKVRITNPKGETSFETTFAADPYGGFDGEFPIPAEATLGSYSLSIVDRGDVSGSATFRIEEYKKPEFEVAVDAPSEPASLGDKVTATIKANYYFGGPVTKAKVHYKVTRSAHTARWYPYGIWDWCYGPGYWWFWPDYTWYPGWSKWGCLRPIPFWWPARHDPPEVVVDADVPIGADGTVKVEIDTALAKAMHGDLDHRYDLTAEVVDESRRTIVGTGQVLVARRPFQVFAWADRGYYRVGDVIRASFRAQTLDQKPVSGKGIVTLYRVTYNADGKPTETAVQTWEVDADQQGDAKLEIKASQAGQYRVAYKLADGKQRAIEGGVVLSVLGQGFDSAQFRYNDLELVADKPEYRPGDTVKLLINTNRAGSTVVLFVRPANSVYAKPRILRLKGKSMLFEVGVIQKDMPNFFIEALTVSGGKVFSETREIVVPPEKRVVNVAVEPSAKEYQPGSTASVKLKLTDVDGKPIVGSAAVAVYDKSVEYISGGSNIPEIREFFWKWRRHHYPQTQSSLDRFSANLLRQLETPMSGVGVFGELVDPDAEDKQNQPSSAKAGGIRLRSMRGDMSKMEKDGGLMPASAAPMSESVALDGLGRAPGAGQAAAEVQPTVRTQFADTAYWLASLEADHDGLAEVSFPMPENLTAWKIRVWTMAGGTRVGQGVAEVVTSKNLLIRMQAPRFFVETDEVVLSANIHNHLKTAKSVKAVLEFEGKTLSPLDETEKTVDVPAGGERRVDWRVKVVEHGEAVIRMKALTDEESDAMQMHFPVRVHGMMKTDAFVGSIRPDRAAASFDVTVPSKRRVNDTLLEIRYSPTLAGAMVDALPYLVNYPHETTDCTLNRFLPTVLTQNILKRMNLNLADVKAKRTNLNAQEIGDDVKRAAGWKRFDENPVFDNDEVARMVKQGVKALAEMQLSDGGWGWFSGWHEHSEPHSTATVVHGLQIAQKNGVALVPGMLEKGVEWLKRYQSEQITRLKNGKQTKPVDPYKTHADNLDALVYMVLVDADVNDSEMQEFLYEDRTRLSVYAKGMFGLALAAVKADEKLAMIVKNIDQYLVQDDENQTAYLKLPDGAYWWFWYDSESEANAYYLKLLSKLEPKGEKAPRLVKYLLNNRKHATYWNSPRDTAIAIEALAEYLTASGEDRPQMTVEVYVDGKKVKEAAIDAQNLFTFDNKVAIVGDALESGVHHVELRKRGTGPLYFNAYLTNFSLEDFITHAGLEVKVARKYYKLERADEKTNVAGARGQVVKERTEKYRRVDLPNLGEVKSGDLIEIELEIDSKNDYEHLVFEDPKGAGLEPFDVRSGYNAEGLFAYTQLRDEKVTFFVRALARGKHSLRYRMRAEIPGRFSALPTGGSAMYAPELKANSDEMKLIIKD